MRTITSLILALLLIMSSLSYTSDSEENGFLKWELIGGAGMQFTSMEMNFEYDYIPSTDRLNNVDPISATANQIIKVIGENMGPGFFFGLNHIISKNFGLQLLGIFHSSKLMGQKNTVSTTLQFSFYPWPYVTPSIVDRKEELNLLDETKGTYNQNTFSLNLLRRFCLFGNVTADLSAGLTLFQFSSQLQPLAYIYWTEDRSSVYFHTDHMVMEIESFLKLGINIGVDFNIPVSRNIVLLLTARYFWSSTVSMDTVIKDFVQDYTNEEAVYLQDIKSTIILPPIKVNPAFFNLSGGLKIRF